MRQYFRIMLGKKSMYATECFEGNFIGADYGIKQDLSNSLIDNWREFNQLLIPVYLKRHPEKSKISAGLSCGALWTIIQGINKGDIVLCPNGIGGYFVGEILSDYIYNAENNAILPHRRLVKWFDTAIDRKSMSQELQYSTGSLNTVCNISKFAQEIELLIKGQITQPVTCEAIIEDATVFALEKHLEDFLVHNWQFTALGQDYDIFSENGELIGQQYATDTGFIDILAISKDKKSILVVELKRGRASDVVVGQILRYMGYVQEELAENDQTVKGVIIALEDDTKIKRALLMCPNIEFYRYEVKFNLHKQSCQIQPQNI
jgi:restriction system protein